jgi:hypothetical protein
MDLASSPVMQLIAERGADGNPLLEEDESVLTKFSNITMKFGDDKNIGDGVLYVTER